MLQFAAPVEIDTPGGYATWKYGLTVLVVAIWPILAQTATLRGEEEKARIDAINAKCEKIYAEGKFLF